MISSVHINDKKKDVLVLAVGPPKGSEHTLTAGKMYSINFADINKILFQFALQWSK